LKLLRAPSSTGAFVIPRLFWIFCSGEFVAFVVLILLVFSGRLKSGPEGPVGAIVLFIPPIGLLILGAVVYFAGTEQAARTGLTLLGLQLVPFVVGPIYSKVMSLRVDRSLLGDDSFRGPQRALAHAIKAGDLAAVKELLPKAGNLNQAYGAGETLLRFAVSNVGSGSSLEIVRALVAAGADPNFPAYSDNYPLASAIYHGPALVRILLEAGANPNQLESTGRPIWWSAIQTDLEEDLPLLRLFLDHGANITLRDEDSGPVAYAADQRRWQAAWLLMERGAAWRDEKRYSVTFAWLVDNAFGNHQNAADRNALDRIHETLEASEAEK